MQQCGRVPLSSPVCCLAAGSGHHEDKCGEGAGEGPEAVGAG
jgi:hypothetical protein